MSLVSHDNFRRMLDLKASATRTSSYETGYNYLIRAIEVAEAELRKIDQISQNYKVEVKSE